MEDAELVAWNVGEWNLFGMSFKFTSTISIAESLRTGMEISLINNKNVK